MGERPISALFGLFADWCVANGHTDMAKRVDCPSFKIEDWTFTLNPSRDERKHGDITVPPFTLLVTNPEGWPGLCGPFGGAMMWGRRGSRHRGARAGGLPMTPSPVADRCTCQPGRDHDGSEFGPCAWCESRAERERLDALLHDQCPDLEDLEDGAWPADPGAVPCVAGDTSGLNEAHCRNTK